MRSSCSAHRSVWAVVLLGATSILLLVCMQEHVELHVSGLKNLQSPREHPDQNPTELNRQTLTLSDLLRKSQTLPEAPGGEPEELQEQEQEQESRRRLVQSVCDKYQLGHLDSPVLRQHVSRVYVQDRYRLLYCEVPKAGCSNWKRVLMVLGGGASSARHIPHDQVHYDNHLHRLDGYRRDAIAERLDSYTKVLFVREPFERLVSAFRDKFENPNPYYHAVFGRAIIARYRPNATRAALSSGAGVGFREFVQYLLDAQRPVGMDIHWQPVWQLCSPCSLGYDFIGRFERLEVEANLLLRGIQAPANLTFPRFKDRDPLAERTSTTITVSYFDTLNSTERQKLYEFYILDYLMFNYTKPFKDLD